MLDTVSPSNLAVSSPAFSVVVPVYNEAVVLPEFHRRLAATMTPFGSWEVVYVNDGSQDASLQVIIDLHCTDPHVAFLNLSRNFGKEIALTAGLEHVTGEAIIVIDADLQDPPELIPELVKGWLEGFDTVYAQRRERDGESWAKRATAKAFYRVIELVSQVPIPRDTGDFRLMSRRVVTAVLQFREQHRFMKGVFAWVGFPSKAVLYNRAPRHAGFTKWNYWRLWNFAIEGITGFTLVPLRIATYLGLSVALLAVIYAAAVVARTLFYGNLVAGYPSLLTVVLLLGGVQLTTLGVMGEYLGRVFNETKGRPLYLLERFEPSGANLARGDSMKPTCCGGIHTTPLEDRAALSRRSVMLRGWSCA